VRIIQPEALLRSERMRELLTPASP
jgi:hypothetical protein